MNIKVLIIKPTINIIIHCIAFDCHVTKCHYIDFTKSMVYSRANKYIPKNCPTYLTRKIINGLCTQFTQIKKHTSLVKYQYMNIHHRK